MSMKVWEALEHTSDLELEMWGASEEELFANAAEALLAQIAEPEDVTTGEEREIAVSGESAEERFLNWLRELLHLDLTRGFLIKRVEAVRLEVERGNYSVSAVARGEKLDAARHRLLHEVKTVTYQDFFYGKKKGRWQARVVFDV